MNITWKEQMVPIKELQPHDKNPRQITAEAYDLLKENIKTLGYHTPVAVNADMTVISGHQRVRALRDLGHKEIRVIVPSRQLTDAEYRQMLIQANVSNGTFDMDMLANDFEIEELLKWGVDEKLLPSLPDEEETPKIKSKKVVTCPECNHEFDV